MKCLCEVEISGRSRFCPHCGRPTASKIAQSGTFMLAPSKATRMLSHNGLGDQASRQSGETTILKDEDWTALLPPKYRATLEAGTAPALIIRELFKQILELRHLLEALVTSWPVELDNPPLERAEIFLRSHCVSCGERTNLADLGKMPLCSNCYSASSNCSS